MPKKELCQLGKEINHALVDLNERKDWLIQRVKEDTNLYFDSSYLHKIETGELKTPSIIHSICRILSIENPYGDKSA